MKRNQKAIFVLLIVLALIPIVGMAAVAPEIEPDTTLLVDGKPVDLPLYCESSGVGTNEAKYECGMEAPVTTDEYQIQSLYVTYKEDPYITYAIGIMDFGAPSSFQFAFSGPVNPVIDECTKVSSSMSLSTTDGGSDGVTVTALAPPAGVPVDLDGITEVQVNTLSDAVGFKNINHDLGGPSFQTLKQSDTWGPFQESGNGPTSATGWNNQQIFVSFQLSGGGDIATLNGRSDVTETTCAPEFPTLFFPAVALIGMLCAVMLIRVRK